MLPKSITSYIEKYVKVIFSSRSKSDLKEILITEHRNFKSKTSKNIVFEVQV